MTDEHIVLTVDCVKRDTSPNVHFSQRAHPVALSIVVVLLGSR